MPTIPSCPASDEYAEFYTGYVAAVSDPNVDIVGLLERQCDDVLARFRPLASERAHHRYAPGKWSVTEVIGHLADAERVFLYRALRFSRGDQTPLPGFDENAYVAAAGFDDRPIAEVLDEYAAVRRASICFFRSLTADAWTRRGTANGHPVSVRAFAYIVAGHERHHLAVLRDRYGV